MSSRRRTATPKPLPAPAEKPSLARERRLAAGRFVPASMMGEEEWLEDETPEQESEDPSELLLEEYPSEEDDEPFNPDTREDFERSPFRDGENRENLRATWIWTGNQAVWCTPFFSDVAFGKLETFRRALNETYRQLSKFEAFSSNSSKKVLESNCEILEAFFANEWFEKNHENSQADSRLSRSVARLHLYLPEKRRFFRLDRFFRGQGDRPSKGTLPKNLEKVWLRWLTAERMEIGSGIDWKTSGAFLSSSYREMLQQVNEAARKGCNLDKDPIGSLDDSTLYKKRRPEWNAMLHEFKEAGQ